MTKFSNLPFVIIFFAMFCTSQLHAQSWTIYNKTNSGMSSNSVAAIAFRQDSSAWIGLHTGGIVTLKNNVWAQVDTSFMPINGYTLADISCAPNNDVWITGNFGNSIARQYKNATTWTIHPFIFNNGWNCLEIDSSGMVWIGNDMNGGLFKYDGINFTAFNETNSGNPNDYVHGIGIVNNKKRWVCGTHEIGLMNDTSWNVFPYLSTPRPIQLDVAVENDTLVWFASTKGLIKYDGIVWTVYNNANSGLPLDSSGSFTTFPKLAIDKNGAKWLATKDFGVVKYDGANWVVYNTTNSLIPSNKINTIEIGKDNAVWIGTDNGLAILSNPVTPLKMDHTIPQIKMSIHPNPTCSKIFVEGFDKNVQSDFVIYDAMGKQMLQGKLQSDINIEQLPNGNYFLEIKNIDKSTFQQIIKQ
jgi:ligand-binding sensor domain-containing protein